MNVTVIKLHRKNTGVEFYAVAENISWWAAVGDGAIICFGPDSDLTIIEKPDEIVRLIEQARQRGKSFRPAPKIGG